MIETVIYLLLFALVFFAVTSFAFNIDDNIRAAKVRNDIDRTIIFVSEHMTESAKLAESIPIIEADRIRFNTADGYVEYRIENSRLIYDYDGLDISFITDRAITINGFIAEEILTQGDERTGVRLTLEISSLKDVKIQKSATYSFLLQ